MKFVVPCKISPCFYDCFLSTFFSILVVIFFEIQTIYTCGVELSKNYLNSRNILNVLKNVFFKFLLPFIYHDSFFESHLNFNNLKHKHK